MHFLSKLGVGRVALSSKVRGCPLLNDTRGGSMNILLSSGCCCIR